MHNNIVAAVSRDHPPMLATERYAQWQSRFMRYIDTRLNGKALRECILQGPYKLSTVTIPGQPVTDESPTVEEQTILETFLNISHENKAHYDAEKEAIHLILTRIGYDIYSTVDACKEIAKPITHSSESASKEDSDPEQVQRDKDMQKNLALITKIFKKIHKHTNNNLETSSNIKNKNVNTSTKYKNDNQISHFGNQKTVTVARARETVGSQMLLCKQAKKGVPLQAEQVDGPEDADEEVDDQELEAYYMYMAKIQEVHTNDSGPSFDAEPLEKADQNAKECDDERVVLANLISNLKLDTAENKKIQNKLKKANTSHFHELQEFKSALEKCKSSLEESNRTRDRRIIALKNKKIELEKYKTYHDRTIEHDTLEHKLKDTLKLLAQKEHDIKEGL
nr:RNA-directed DNA polymerase, eukaryota [Tanacetum cinerariifolium]